MYQPINQYLPSTGLTIQISDFKARLKESQADVKQAQSTSHELQLACDELWESFALVSKCKREQLKVLAPGCALTPPAIIVMTVLILLSKFELV